MGWLYKDSLNGHRTPSAYLDHQFTFEGEACSYRVLRSSLVQMKRYYAAVERVLRETGERSVIAVVCLVDYSPRSKTGHAFGYKDMDETMEPGEYDCPAAILDLLTPTTSEHALSWRDKCRKRLAKPTPKAGQTLVLETPVRFRNGELLARFAVVEQRSGRRKKLFFRGENGGFYNLGNLRDREYTIAPQADAPPAPQSQRATLFASH